MEKITIGRNTLRLGVTILAVIVLATAFWLIRTATQQAQAQSPIPTTGSAAPNATDGGPFDCTISNIAVFSNRIHVYCSAAIPSTNIRYFAASGDSAHALATNRFLMMLNTAYALGKHVYIYYLDSSASNPAGCNAGDCRAIDWMFIVP